MEEAKFNFANLQNAPNFQILVFSLKMKKARQ